MSRTLGLNFGEMIRPLIESTRVFVHVIAGTFAAYKLIPPDYPGLKDQFAPMSLTKVFWTAWKNLRFSKDNLVQILVFFAVLSFLVFAGLFIATFVLSLLSGSAHAEGVFAPADRDAAQAWLEFLFNGGELPAFDAGSVASSSWGLQSILSLALGYYSNAMLLIAAIVLFYHLATMVVETAHSGVPMGKTSRQIWAPIRLVLAVGLLVPVNSSGLNAGQYIVIKTAELGSGLATQVWDVFLTRAIDPASAGASVAAPMVYENAVNLMAMYACAIDFDARGDYRTWGRIAPSILGDASSRLPLQTETKTIDGVRGTLYHFGFTKFWDGKNYLDVCGSVFVPLAASSDLAERAREAQQSAFDASLESFYGVGENILKLIPPDEAERGTAGEDDSETIDFDATTPLTDYQNDLFTKLNNISLDDDGVADAAIDAMRPYGWAFAGTFLTSIQRVISSQANALLAGQITTTAPTLLDMEFSDELGPNNSHNNIYAKVKADMDLFMPLLNQRVSSGASAAASADDVQCAAMIGAETPAESYNSNWAIAALQKFANDTADWTVNKVLGVVDSVATWNGVWSYGTGTNCSGAFGSDHNTFQLGTTLSNGTEAMTDLVNFGRANIQTGLRLVVWGSEVMIGSAVGGALVTAASAGAGFALALVGMAFGGMLFFIASIFLMLGFVFAFMLPLIMFTRFFFAVIIWIGEVCESVVAIPVVALAHLNPDGDGFLPEKAKTAYSFIFSIFLRPVMTVFGLILGMLIFTVAANFLDYTYSIAIAATGATAYDYLVLTKIAFTILYVYTMYICANMSFQMITHVPNGSVAWMGGASSQTPNLGAFEHLQQYEAIAGSIAINEGSKAMGGAAKQVADQFAPKKPAGGGGGGTAGGGGP